MQPEGYREEDLAPTGEIAVHIPLGQDPDAIAARHGYVNKGFNTSPLCYYLFLRVSLYFFLFLLQ